MGIRRSKGMMEKATTSPTVKSSHEHEDGLNVHTKNHPVLARMMKSLEQKRFVKKNHSAQAPSETFVAKNSFATSNNNAFFGREEEKKQLLAILNRLVLSSSCTATFETCKRSNEDGKNYGKSELVLLHGKSGTGKSTLVRSFVKSLSHQVFFVQGKFDQLKSHIPYAALINACNELAKQILQHENSKEIMDAIKSHLGPDIAMLGVTLPVMSHMADEKTSMGTANDMDGQSFTRFKLLMRTFLRCVAMGNTPVILFLDDLQWADVGTLEVLRALLSDRMSQNIMFLFAYREDEMDRETLQQLQHTELSDSSEKFGVRHTRTTEISVANLDLTSLNKMMNSILRMDEKQTQNLTKIVHNKTGGNPFHAINFLDMLHSTGMLFQNQNQQDEGHQKWNWDCNYILQQTDVSDNLADLLESKILRLPEKIRSILQLASFIGYDFSTDVLTTIVHEEQDMIEGEYSFELFDRNVIHQWIIQALDVASKEGLVEMTSDSNTYKFSHDRIQQCLYKDLIPDDVERRLLHQRIGKLLWQTIKTRNASDIDDWILFLATDNLNRGPKFVDDDMDRCEMIELNLRAARVARDKVAFHVSVEYLRCGEKLIKDDEFIKSNHDLCVSFLNAAADGEKMIGCFDRCNELLSRVFKHSRSLQDCFPAYMIEIQVTAEQKELKDAIELAFKRLRLVGVKFPRNITLGTVVKDLIRTKLLIGKRKPEDLMRLPKMTDKHKLFAMELMCALHGYAFFAGEVTRLMFVALLLRTAYLTVRYGLSDLYAPQALMGYGLVHSVLGKFDIATLYGDLGMSLLRRSGAEKSYGKTMVMYLNFIHPWRHGLEGMIDGLKDSYHKALQAGEVEYAYLGLSSRLYAGLYTKDVPLFQLAKEAKAWCVEMGEYGLKTQQLVALPLVQMLLNMAGDKETSDPVILSGGVIDFEEFSREIQEKKFLFVERVIQGYEALLAYYFRDWELLEKKVSVVLASKLNVKGFFTTPFIISSMAWYCCLLYKQTGKKRYKQNARSCHSKIEKFAKEGNILGFVLSKQLTAGKALYIKKKSPGEAEDLFIDALEEMKARNMSYNPAHMSESLAEAFIEVGDVVKAVHYLQLSIDISKEWGAFAKVKPLEKQLSELRCMSSSTSDRMQETQSSDTHTLFRTNEK